MTFEQALQVIDANIPTSTERNRNGETGRIIEAWSVIKAVVAGYDN